MPTCCTDVYTQAYVGGKKAATFYFLFFYFKIFLTRLCAQQKPFKVAARKKIQMQLKFSNEKIPGVYKKKSTRAKMKACRKSKTRLLTINGSYKAE